MTKQQILAEIAAKIDGQGSAIDAGSALPGILRGILDLIPKGPSPIAPEPMIRIIIEGSIAEAKTRSEMALLLGITEEELDELPNQLIIGQKGVERGYELTRTIVYIYDEGWNVVFGSLGENAGLTFEISNADGVYTTNVKMV